MTRPASTVVSWSSGDKGRIPVLKGDQPSMPSRSGWTKRLAFAACLDITPVGHRGNVGLPGYTVVRASDDLIRHHHCVLNGFMNVVGNAPAYRRVKCLYSSLRSTTTSASAAAVGECTNADRGKPPTMKSS
ncbi:MAG: hypothetical protein IPM83_16170 [Ignavibacteria bacterium]|nr:hypothetical protein [Ignavibacteria bacterium]